MSFLRIVRRPSVIALTRGGGALKPSKEGGDDNRKFTQQAMLLIRDKPPRRSQEQLHNDMLLIKEYSRMKLRESHIEMADYARKARIRKAALDSLPLDLRYAQQQQQQLEQQHAPYTLSVGLIDWLLYCANKQHNGIGSFQRTTTTNNFLQRVPSDNQTSHSGINTHRLQCSN
jgi:hypothetical protein